MCVLVPKNTSAASITVSERVGWGWMVNATSLASAAISIASTPSAIISPAPAPTMPTPSTRSVCGSSISFVIPSGRSRVIARPDAAQGNFATGEDPRRDRIGLESDLVTGNRFDRHPAFRGRLMGEHRFADYIADRVDR